MHTVNDPRKGATSASSASYDAVCSGRFLAQKGLPDVKSEEAESGSAIHAALADSTKGGLPKLSLEQRELFDSCRDIEKRLASGYFGDAKEVKVFREERFWAKVPDGKGGHFNHSGQADVVYRSGSKVLCLDYKTGNNEAPESPRNMQLRDLAVLTRGAFVLVDEVATAIVQPLVTHTPEVCVYTKADLDTAQAAMFARVIASNDPASPRVAGKPQCDFCLAARAGKCLEYQKWAGALTPPALQELVTVAMANWTPAQAARAADALAPAYDFLDQVKAYLKEHVPPGWTLAPGNKREVITNPQECFTRFAALGGTLEQFMGTIAVGKTKLREALNTVTGAKGMALDKAVTALTQGIVDVSQNAPSLKKVKE